MPLPFDKRNPDLARQIDDVYHGASLDQGKKIGDTALGNMLDSQVAQAQAQAPDEQNTQETPQPENGFKDIRNAYKNYKIFFFNSAGIRIPTQLFLDKNIEQRYGEMTRAGENPEVVIAPILDLEQWQEVFSHLPGGNGAPNGVGLEFDEEIVKNWDKLKSQNAELPKIVEQFRDLNWSVAILENTPTDDAPIYKGSSSTLVKAEYNPTINEYLMLQATRLIDGKPLLDRTGRRRTWLNGRFKSSPVFGYTLVPCGTFDQESNKVKILPINPNITSGLGARRTERF